MGPQALGLSCAAELAFVSHRDVAALAAHLKPIAAAQFVRALHTALRTPWQQLQDVKAHRSDCSIAIERLLDDFGVGDEALLKYLNAEQVDALAACLKPAPRALFKQSVAALQAAAAADDGDDV